MQPTREQAWEWLKEYTKSEALRRHDFEHDNALILQKLYALL